MKKLYNVLWYVVEAVKCNVLRFFPYLHSSYCALAILYHFVAEL